MLDGAKVWFVVASRRTDKRRRGPLLRASARFDHPWMRPRNESSPVNATPALIPTWVLHVAWKSISHLTSCGPHLGSTFATNIAYALRASSVYWTDVDSKLCHVSIQGTEFIFLHCIEPIPTNKWDPRYTKKPRKNNLSTALSLSFINELFYALNRLFSRVRF